MQNDELRLVLFTSQSAVLKLDEFVRIFRHRSILLYYFVPISILALTNVRGGPSEIPVWFNLSVYMFGTFVMICAILAQVALLRWAIRRPPILNLHLTPIMIIAICCSTTVGEMIVHAYVGLPPNTVMQLAMLVLFYLIVTELQFAIATQFIVPGVLREMRGHRPRPKDWLVRRLFVRLRAQFALPATTPDALVAPQGPLDAPTARASSRAFSQAATKTTRTATGPNATFKDITLPLADVLQIEAEGNYVLIHTAQQRQQILLRFSQAVAEMPEDLGLLVHRSHWIAIAAIAGYHRQGRDIVVTLTNGAKVTVAQSRQSALLPRLRDLMAQRGT